MCDGVNIKDDKKPMWRSGQVTERGAANYAEFKVRMRAICAAGQGAFRNTEMLELTERSGFGFAMKAAIEKVSVCACTL